MLIPARNYGYIRGDIPLSDLTKAWSKSLNVLERLTHVSPSASRCLAILRALDQTIVPEDGTIISNHENAVVGPNTTVASRPTVVSGPLVSQADIVENVADSTVIPQVQAETQDMFSDPAAPQLQNFGWFDSLLVDWSSIENLDVFNLGQTVPA